MYIHINIYTYVFVCKENCKVTCTKEATEMAGKYLLQNKMWFD